MSETTKAYNLFDVSGGLCGRRAVLFGSGKYAEYYMEKYGKEHTPFFLADNDQGKWGSRKFGLEIRDPSEILKLPPETYCVIVAVRNYGPVLTQLEHMGIGTDACRVYSRWLEQLALGGLQDTKAEGKYHTGFVTGVFDLFHIGHLNLLRNCKSRCHYLIAGVLTDELTLQDKHKRPFIAFDERIEIVRQCKYVDRAVMIDFHNTNKVDAWKELRYGCLFSGSDHEGQGYWMDLQQQLRYLGSELEFFPYTQSTSSTMLQAAIRKEGEGKENL